MNVVRHQEEEERPLRPSHFFYIILSAIGIGELYKTRRKILISYFKFKVQSWGHCPNKTAITKSKNDEKVSYHTMKGHWNPLLYLFILS